MTWSCVSAMIVHPQDAEGAELMIEAEHVGGNPRRPSPNGGPPE